MARHKRKPRLLVRALNRWAKAMQGTDIIDIVAMEEVREK